MPAQAGMTPETWHQQSRPRQTSMRRPQPRDQPIDIAGDHGPILEPVAREAQREVGALDAPLVEADAGGRTPAVAAAAREERRGRGVIDQVLALVGRALAE